GAEVQGGEPADEEPDLNPHMSNEMYDRVPGAAMPERGGWPGGRAEAPRRAEVAAGCPCAWSPLPCRASRVIGLVPIPLRMSRQDDTPLMQQWRQAKARHADAIVLFRVGDFYEMFH